VGAAFAAPAAPTMPELIPITLPMASWTPSVAVGSHGLTALPFRQGGFIVYCSP
jgi:hypothetical protein